MFGYLADNLANILVLSAVVLLLFASAGSLLKQRKKKSCDGNCASCAFICKDSSDKKAE